jgi:hypothetical protein
VELQEDCILKRCQTAIARRPYTYSFISRMTAVVNQTTDVYEKAKKDNAAFGLKELFK